MMYLYSSIILIHKFGILISNCLQITFGLLQRISAARLAQHDRTIRALVRAYDLLTLHVYRLHT